MKTDEEETEIKLSKEEEFAKYYSLRAEASVFVFRSAHPSHRCTHKDYFVPEEVQRS